MSVEENKAMVRRVIEEAWNKGNMAVIDEHLSPDYVHHNLPPGMPHDREGYKQMVRKHHAAFSGFHLMIEDEVAEGDKVALRFKWSGMHTGEYLGIAPTGKQIAVTALCMHRIEGDKEVEQWAQVDQVGLMQQLGVVPPPGRAGG
jgi:predicted ester cyclase